MMYTQMQRYPWIKFYGKTLDDPRVGRLGNAAWRRYLELQLLAGECNEGGRLVYDGRPLTIEEMAWRLRITPRRMKLDLKVLESRGLAQWDGETWGLAGFQETQGRPEPAARPAQKEQNRRRISGETEAGGEEQAGTQGTAGGAKLGRVRRAASTARKAKPKEMSARMSARVSADTVEDTGADIQHVRALDKDKEEIERELEKEEEEEELRAIFGILHHRV